MTEQEMVQTALASLPRPTPPPRLRRAVMAQVRREATVQVQTWSRTQSDGWTTENWEGAAPEPLPAQTAPNRTAVTQWRQASGNRVTTYQTIRTH